MIVRELGNRVWQIYAFTVLLGSIILSIGMTLVNIDFSYFLIILISSLAVSTAYNLPNILVLNLGLKYIYNTAKKDEEKRKYFFYLWLTSSSTPLLIIVIFSIYVDGRFYFSLQELWELLKFLPYNLSSLYFIFKINNKFDKTYPPDFSKNQNISIDILDDDF